MSKNKMHCVEVEFKPVMNQIYCYKHQVRGQKMIGENASS